jgi:hypothetical protein
VKASILNYTGGGSLILALEHADEDIIHAD